MTNKAIEEAISKIKHLQTFADNNEYWWLRDFMQSFDLAVEVLEQNLSMNQESILNKIRSEIEQTVEHEMNEDKKWAIGLKYSLQIIDKYRAESEGI